MKDIFLYIENKAEELGTRYANKFSYQTEKEKQEETECWQYWFTVLFTQGFITLIALIFSLIFGYTVPMFIFMVAYGMCRVKSGGLHCDTFKKCTIVTNLTIIIAMGLVFLLKNYCFIYFVCILPFIIYKIPIAPKPSQNSIKRSEKTRNKFKQQFANNIIFLYVANVILLILHYFSFLDLSLQINSITTAFFICSFNLSKIGEWLIKKI